MAFLEEIFMLTWQIHFFDPAKWCQLFYNFSMSWNIYEFLVFLIHGKLFCVEYVMLTWQQKLCIVGILYRSMEIFAQCHGKNHFLSLSKKPAQFGPVFLDLTISVLFFFAPKLGLVFLPCATWFALGMIRLQRVYNFLLFHVIMLSVLDVLYALVCYFIFGCVASLG